MSHFHIVWIRAPSIQVLFFSGPALHILGLLEMKSGSETPNPECLLSKFLSFCGMSHSG